MRKHSLPPELLDLTPEQIAQLNNWLDRMTYAKIQVLFQETYGKPIGPMKLCRYYKHLQKARALSTAANAPLTASDIVAIENGTPILDERLNRKVLMQRVLKMAPRVNTARELKDLHDICTYNQRRSWKERDLDMEEHRAKMRISRAERRERELVFRNHLAALKHGSPEPDTTTTVGTNQ